MNQGVRVKMWDLGGDQRFRDNWEKFCRVSDAILFVVDSTDLANIEQAKSCLFELLAWPSLEQIPV